MSLYNERGYETPKMKITIMALLSVRSQRNGVSGNDGTKAVMTCGMLSPTMMQNATMPPNALKMDNQGNGFVKDAGRTYKAHWAIEMATRPDLPKQCCMVAWNESVPLSFELMTIRRIVQSTTTVRPTSRTTPVRRPACLKAYG